MELHKLFSYVRLNGTIEKKDYYITCIRLLIVDLNEAGFCCIWKLELLDNGAMALYIGLDRYVIQPEFIGIVDKWNSLLRGLGFPIDEKIEYGYLTPNIKL